MENPTETKLLSQEADKALNQIMPLLNGLSFIEIKDVIEGVWEHVEKKCILTMPIASNEPKPKEEAPKSRAESIEEMVTEIKRRFKDAGINGGVILERVPNPFNGLIEALEEIRKK